MSFLALVLTAAHTDTRTRHCVRATCREMVSEICTRDLHIRTRRQYRIARAAWERWKEPAALRKRYVNSWLTRRVRGEDTPIVLV